MTPVGHLNPARFPRAHVTSSPPSNPAAPEVTALLQLARPAAVVADAGCAALARQAAGRDRLVS